MSPKKPKPKKRAVKAPATTKAHARNKGKAADSKPQVKNAPAPAPGGPMTPPPSGVKVRMYRTGLGDCFLLAFPKGPGSDGQPAGAFYLLLDCGVYKGTPEPDNATRIRRIVTDIRDATGGRLDLLVITHEHWDHVSAFHPSQAQDLFDKDVRLDKLWMAWTENLSIKLAKDLHEGRKAARAVLDRALARMQAMSRMGADSEAKGLVQKVLDFFGDLVNGQSSLGPAGSLGAATFGAKSRQTEEAMEWIKDNYGKGKTQFLHPGDGPLSFDSVPDARVYILGPPEDAALIKRYNPTASGAEVYPKAMAAAIEGAFFAAFGMVPTQSEDVKEAQKLSLPFDEEYQVKADAARKDEFFQQHYYDKRKSPEWRQIEADWLETAGEFALQLDSATNNTSLAFALEVGPPGAGKVLLFPGDAQVGNWESWFGKVKVGKQELGKDMAWKVAGKEVTAEDLLRRTVLYKVGHHGSHNATLKAKGLELMGRPGAAGDLVALLPVNEHVARDLAHYGEMPLRSLVKDLAIRTGGRVARNDEGDEPKGKQSTLAPIPGAPPISSGFATKTDLYFEYTVASP
jgi:hypothetical protein